MGPIGTAILSRNLTHTKKWPGLAMTSTGFIDMGAKYRRLLSSATVSVLEISGDEYLILCTPKDESQFIWSISARDVLHYMPVINRGGFLVNTDDTTTEQILQIFKQFEDFTL